MKRPFRIRAARRHSTLLLLAQKLKNFALGEATAPMLREDEFSIHDNIKDTVVILDQLWLDAELIGDSGRQTGGLMHSWWTASGKTWATTSL